MSKLYRVRVCQENVYDVLVDAATPEEAEEKVSDALDAGYHPAVTDRTAEQIAAHGGVRLEQQDVSEEPHVLDDSAELAGTDDADADRANGLKQSNA